LLELADGGGGHGDASPAAVGPVEHGPGQAEAGTFARERPADRFGMGDNLCDVFSSALERGFLHREQPVFQRWLIEAAHMGEERNQWIRALMAVILRRSTSETWLHDRSTTLHRKASCH
jgi:hypothetical protein